MNKKDIHCMLDLETLGHNSDAAIIQIGMIIFDIKDIRAEFKININWKNAVKYGEVTASTLMWWLRQENEAQLGILKEGYNSADACIKVTNFLLRNYEIKHFWAHATFDFPILTNLYTNLDIINSINFRKCRDLRTMDALYPMEWTEKKGVYHDALDDAIYQTERLQKQLHFHIGD